MSYKPRNQNPRSGDAPHSWSQRFYDMRPAKHEPVQCGFRIPKNDSGERA